MDTKLIAQKLQALSPLVLRLGLAAVMIWFGASQLNNPNAWTSLVPNWALSLSGMSALTVVYTNGFFEIIAGAMIAFGFWSRWAALFLALHLLVITADLGVNDIGIRDFGLSIALLAIAINETDAYCIKK
ncbi:MAG: DoxX family membrane protein [Candidatus Magasanikbacteria bacterium]|nr:DoxX family membrane protein [Candidatus Magasanikbacteria bacterium]